MPVYAAFRHEVDRHNSNVSTTLRVDKVTRFVDVNNNVVVTRARKTKSCDVVPNNVAIFNLTHLMLNRDSR